MEKFVKSNFDLNHPKEHQFKSHFKSKNVTLLACPWVFQGEPEFQSQQLGLAYIGSYLIECGHNVVKYIDPMLNNGHTKSTPIQTEYQTIYRVGISDEEIINQIPNDCEYILINAPFTDSRFVFYPQAKRY